MQAIAKMNAGGRVQHRFQSFWYGGGLSPYEFLCLKSFIDCGHAFDLYTYDPDLAVPAGVQVRDASELIDRSEVFVYQPEGFGKGSPSAFSNLFRSKLMVEKGGWWTDTDVVCLTDRSRRHAILCAPGRGLCCVGHHVFRAEPSSHGAMPGSGDEARSQRQMG